MKKLFVMLLSLFFLWISGHAQATEFQVRLRPLSFNFCEDVRSLLWSIQAQTSLPIELKRCQVDVINDFFGGHLPDSTNITISYQYERCPDEFYKVLKLGNQAITRPEGMQSIIFGLGFDLFYYADSREPIIMGVPRCLIMNQRGGR